MHTEAHITALAVTSATHALEGAAGQCSAIERHVEHLSGKFLHLATTVEFSKMQLPISTARLFDHPEQTHWFMLAQHLQYLAAQFAALSSD